MVASLDGIFCPVGGLDASIVVNTHTMLSSECFESASGRYTLPHPNLWFVEVHMLPHVFEVGFGTYINIPPSSAAPQSDDTDERIDYQ